MKTQSEFNLPQAQTALCDVAFNNNAITSASEKDPNEILPKENYFQEFDMDTGKHRLVCKKTGGTSSWESYRNPCTLGGYIGMTSYYREGVYTLKEFFKVVYGIDV